MNMQLSSDKIQSKLADDPELVPGKVVRAPLKQAIPAIEEFLLHEQSSTLARNLSAGIRELTKARESIGLADISASPLHQQ